MTRPEVGALAGLVVLLVLFSVVVGLRGFLSPLGAMTIVAGAAQVAVLGAVVTLLMITGEFDLSIGSMIGATTMIMALGLSEGVPFWMCLLGALAFAIFVGLIHAGLVVGVGLNSIVVTLGSLFILRGVATYIYLRGPGELAPGWQGFGPTISSDPLNVFLASEIGIVPVSLLIWFVVAVAAGTFVLNGTAFGNWVFAIGGSRSSAHAVGVPSARVRAVLFVATAVTATAIAAIELATVGSASGTRGANREFEVILAVFIGGTILGGGWGTVIGTAIGALTLATVRQGLSYSLVWSNAYQALTGLAVLAAVIVNELVRRRGSRTR